MPTWKDTFFVFAVLTAFHHAQSLRCQRPYMPYGIFPVSKASWFTCFNELCIFHLARYICHLSHICTLVSEASRYILFLEECGCLVRRRSPLPRPDLGQVYKIVRESGMRQGDSHLMRWNLRTEAASELGRSSR